MALNAKNASLFGRCVSTDYLGSSEVYINLEGSTTGLLEKSATQQCGGIETYIVGTNSVHTWRITVSQALLVLYPKNNR